MFSKKDFQDWGKNEVVLFASVMTRIEGRKNDDLLRTYGFRGFPSMAILDASGEAISKKVGRSLDGMRTVVGAAAKMEKLKADKAAGADISEADLFLARLGLGNIKLEADQKKLAELKLTPAQKAKAEGILLGAEIEGLFRGMRRSGPAKVASRVYELYKAGKRLPASSPYMNGWKEMLAMGAKAANDAKAFSSVYEDVMKLKQDSLVQIAARRKRFADNQRAQDFFDNQEKQIKKQIADLKAQAEKFAEGK